MAAARDADLFIYSSTQFLGSLVPEKTGIPSIAIAICPPHVARGPENDDATQASPCQGTQTMPPPVDGEPLVHLLDHISEFRGSLGLQEEPHGRWLGSDHVIAAISSHFCDPDTEKYPNIDFTGFWFHERPEWRNWRPSSSLERFVEKGDPPLVLTFSSLPLRDARSVLRIHAETARLLSRRLVIVSGWAGFQKKDIPRECREHVLVIGELPHEWLFARSAAVIHHGGIGTLAQAARCGKPMLVEPYGNDQFFNASRAVKLGIGAAAHPRWMTPEALAEVLKSKVLSSETCKRVRKLADALSSDPGVEYAVDLVMERL
jgi:UDP:flavonoid glycosyltransferase YjiC (YdhE family)